MSETVNTLVIHVPTGAQSTVERPRVSPELSAGAMIRSELAATDAGMARVGEDVIAALIAAELIAMDDLPADAQAKLSRRAELRAELAG